MKTKDFFYELPPELIADTAAEPRDASRLLVLDRLLGEITHGVFSDVADFLTPDDVLVVNNSKVLPARLLSKLSTGAECEILLLREHKRNVWECLVRPGKKLRRGRQVVFGDGALVATIEEVLADGNRYVSFMARDGDVMGAFHKFGRMPLPPYIKNSGSDDTRYQTVYAKHLGSAAAPTAGLHFTEQLLQKLEQKGVKRAEVTLHVGLGTFRPVEAEEVSDHVMHSEWYSVDEVTAELLNKTKQNGGRIVAVGTTAARTLEGLYRAKGRLCAHSGETDIFITPGCEFNVVDALITNFHLPQSTLLMLVSAFAGSENIKRAYEIAIEKRYRFYSFGDAMFIK